MCKVICKNNKSLQSHIKTIPHINRLYEWQLIKQVNKTCNYQDPDPYGWDKKGFKLYCDKFPPYWKNDDEWVEKSFINNRHGDCVICFESMKYKKIFTNYCGHTFCDYCHKRIYNHKCPMCRSDIKCNDKYCKDGRFNFNDGHWGFPIGLLTQLALH